MELLTTPPPPPPPTSYLADLLKLYQPVWQLCSTAQHLPMHRIPTTRYSTVGDRVFHADCCTNVTEWPVNILLLLIPAWKLPHLKTALCARLSINLLVYFYSDTCSFVLVRNELTVKRSEKPWLMERHTRLLLLYSQQKPFLFNNTILPLMDQSVIEV